MPSPFPGVDPYVEASGRWIGFHNVFIAICSEVLNQVLPDAHVANTDERVLLVESTGEQSRGVLPDVTETRSSPRRSSGRQPNSGGGTVTIEPETLTLPEFLEVPEAFIEIATVPGGEVVTTIELLSPTNKSGAGRGEYLVKRRALLHRGINLVEVDLLVRGERLETVEPLPRGDYYAFVSRADRRPECDVYAWGLRHPLPAIPVPLKAPDLDVPLDLATVFTLTYDRGRYDRTLPYGSPPGVPLAADDLAWAVERARAAAGR